ncbi:MAG: L-aspartate oxidase [Actinomycetia bacterium]|nr:L-aspartate oxidase [Actinomycetes bacterium]
MFDLLVLGSGVAGLTTALHAARRGMSVLVVTKGELSHSATRYAQGGVAAALASPDSPELHLADTLVAGAGLCDGEAVRILVNEGPARVRELAALGATFDTDLDDDGVSQLLLAREGGHSLARVVHAGGDQTGAEIERALVDALHRADVEVREGWFALELLVERDRCAGVLAIDPSGEPHYVRALDTVLATGGAGQCFAVTTNPALSTGDGIALALRAGVACADLEFMQFHPTALHHPSMPRPLLSEAVRGEGAILRDDRGVAFMVDEHPLADLAPRDVVSRAITQLMQRTGAEHVWLDATMVDDFEHRFPTIWAACQSVGLDPTENWLPVAPAAHYMSGGVMTDLDGATTLSRLWACGETACSGVHGANRLASNSLLDGLVFGARVVDAIARGKTEAEPTGVMAGVLDLSLPLVSVADPVVLPKDRATDPAKLRASIQRVMSQDCGVVRDAASLEMAAQTLADLATLAEDLPARQAATYEALNLARVSQAIVANATARTESRGSHTRRDYPERSDELLGRFVATGDSAPRFVPLAEPALPRAAQ